MKRLLLVSDRVAFDWLDFERSALGENVIRRVSDGVMMKDGQIILSEGAGISSGSTWSVFTVGDLCSHRRAFVFKLGGRCDKVAVGFCFPGSSPGQEEILMKRLQVTLLSHTFDAI